MRTGTVKFLNIKNKFGFIIDDEDKKEYYVRTHNIEGIVHAEDKVTYEFKEAKRGQECVNVKKVS
jgi:CspA family cold shock protein